MMFKLLPAKFEQAAYLTFCYRFVAGVAAKH